MFKGKGKDCSLVIPTVSMDDPDGIEVFCESITPLVSSVTSDHEIVKAIMTIISEEI